MSRVKKKRQEEIFKIIKTAKECSLIELSEKTGVSLPTIRRDAIELEQKYPVVRTAKGVLYQESSKSPFPDILRFVQEHNVNADAKKQIATKAIHYINEGDHIFLSGGSTTWYLAQEIKRRNFSNLTIMTNSFPIITDFYSYENIRTICLGGELNKTEGTFLGTLPLKMIQEIRIAKAFMGVQGISLEQGVTHYSSIENIFDKEISGISSQVYLLADSSKFSQVYSLFWDKVEAFHKIISEKN